jgi:glycosyltransferase involved in cell wall biosynthesis
LAGAERSLLQLVTELTRDHGALCSVVMPGEGPLHRAMADAGAAVIQAGYDWWGVAPPKKLPPEGRRILQPQAKALARKVLPYLAQIDPDVIWSQSIVNPWGAVAAGLLRKPHVWSVCEFGQLDYGIQFVAPFERVLQDVLSSSDLVYVNSRKVLETLFPQAGAKCRVLYRHIEIPGDLPEGGQTGLFRRSGALRLGVFASLRGSKGQEDAIHAVAELVREGRNVELVLAGYGEAKEEARLGSLIKTHRLEGHVYMTGFVQEVLRLMGETDVILFCSRNEAFGRVGVEAMLLGKPVVYADCLEYMIDGKTGLSYPVGDAAALAAGIRRLMDHPEERALLGAEAQRYARSRFSAEAYGGEVYKALSALRDSGTPGRVPSVLQDFITPEMAELIKVNPNQLDRESPRLTSPKQKKERSRNKREAGDLLPSTLRKMRKFLDRQQRSLGKRKLELTALVDEWKVRLSPNESNRLGRQPRLIALSGLFDEAWYRAAYAERVLKSADAIIHYLRIGAAMGLEPNPLFDSKWYIEHTPGIPKGINPLVHYIRYGRRRGAKPNAYWNPTLYLEANPDAGMLKNALRHYLNIGVHDDRLPEPVPDSTFHYEAEPAESCTSTTVRAIAFYLPQFHRIPENDQWWGNGFTEWTNVRSAEPQFHGHYQPHEPHLDVGYYDLTDPTVMVRQAEMARRFGIHGFCFHHYWFGGKRLLEKPVEWLLQTGKPDFPFCLCWANENWTRRWDGAEHELLIAQKHSAQDDQQFILDVIRFFRDPRYIRISGKPLLIVYRPSLLPNPRATFSRWRKACKREGIGEVYLAGAQSFGFEDPRPLELDAAVEFPPHAATVSRVKPCDHGLPAHTEFNGLLYSYRQALLYTMSRRTPPYKAFPAVMPSWDNTARLKKKGRIFVNSSPRAYYSWLRHAVMEARSRFEGDERLVFINAWNEWAEGCHLEPDQRYGYAWLNTTSRAVLAGQSVERSSKALTKVI